MCPWSWCNLKKLKTITKLFLLYQIFFDQSVVSWKGGKRLLFFKCICTQTVHWPYLTRIWVNLRCKVRFSILHILFLLVLNFFKLILGCTSMVKIMAIWLLNHTFEVFWKSWELHWKIFSMESVKPPIWWTTLHTNTSGSERV